MATKMNKNGVSTCKAGEKYEKFQMTVRRKSRTFHHERLDGTGYPFGKSADELNECERIMACVDIYQALTESRPYKKGMTHEKAIGILEDMAQKGWLDKNIVLKTDECFSV